MISRGPHGLRGGPRDARRSRGAVAVEFALVVQLFMAMTFGMVDMSRLMFARWMISYGIERAGRVASLRSTVTLTKIQDEIENAATLINFGSTAVVVKVSGTTVTTDAAFVAARQTGDPITVTTAYTFRRMLPFVLPQTTYTINGSTQTVAE
jgi:Flp pilus assembly protein TadG